MPRSPLATLPLLGLCLLTVPLVDAATADGPVAAPSPAGLPPGSVVGADARFGTIRSLHCAGGLALAGPAPDAGAAVRALVRAHGQQFGDPALLDDAVVLARDWTNAQAPLHTLVWDQVIDGIPVQDGHFIATLSPANAILTIGSSCVPQARSRAAAARALGLVPRLDAPAAIAAAFGVSATVATSATPGDVRRRARWESDTVATIDTGLVWALRGSALVLAWEITGTESRTGNRWQVTVDARDGAILGRLSLTRYGAGAPPQLSATAPAPHGAARAGSFAAPRAAPPATRATAAAITRGLTSGTVYFEVFAPTSAITAMDASAVDISGESPTPQLPGWSGPEVTPDDTFPNWGANTNSSPFYPPPSTSYPMSRQIFQQSSAPAESPNGWVLTDQTAGNNCTAGYMPDAGGNPSPITGTLADGTGTGPYFVPPLNSLQAEDPENYPDASVVNLFYWMNFMHDRTYDLGFTEAAGNFQATNFTNQGVGNDAVQAGAQYASALGAVDNYFFSTQADGSWTLMGMFLYNGPTWAGNGHALPRRDSDFDATLMCQAYGMGVATRLVGNGGQLNDLQCQGLASGWGDFLSLALLSPYGSDPSGYYQIGAYAALDYLGVLNYQNYYQGIRHYPYTTNTVANPASLAQITDLLDSNPPIVADAPLPAGNAQPGVQGQLWGEALWLARAAWLHAYAASTIGSTAASDQTAYKAANDAFLSLVLAGMQLCPPEPTYTEARDALLLADVQRNAGANQSLLWTAFAQVGLGPQTECGPAQDTSAIPDSLPPGSLLVIGGSMYAGGEPGQFSAGTLPTKTYTLQNLTNAPIGYSISQDQGWIAVTPASGTVPANGSVTVTVTVTTSANTLAVGDYTGHFTVTDGLDSAATRAVELDISGIYVESPATYTWLTPSPVSGNTLPITDNAFYQLQMPFRFQFYGQWYNTINVGANGVLSFIKPQPNDALHSAYNVPLGSPFPVNAVLAPLWFALNPDLGGTISYGIQGTSPYRILVITYSNLQPAGGGAGVTFQVQLQETTNQITYVYQNLAQTSSYGGGRPATVGVEDSRGILFTQHQSPGSVSIPDQTAISYTYSLPPGYVSFSAAGLSEGGTGQCGIGYGLSALAVGGLLVAMRRRSRGR